MLTNCGRVYLRQCFCHRNPAVRNIRFTSTESKSQGSDPISAKYVPNRLEKYLLVWIKKYPSVKDVPERVTPDEMHRVRDWARIKLNIGACVATALACVYMIMRGKEAAKKGESLQKINLDWHKAQRSKE